MNPSQAPLHDFGLLFTQDTNASINIVIHFIVFQLLIGFYRVLHQGQAFDIFVGVDIGNDSFVQGLIDGIIKPIR